MSDWIRRHRISVDEYHRMVKVGLLSEDARVELIEGEIIDMAPMGAGHGSAVLRLTKLFSRAAGDLAHVSVQSAIRLGDLSEPQPDLALVAPHADFYGKGLPSAVDTFLIVEVSDSTLRYDLKVKVPLYARHEIPEVWIIDLNGRKIRRFRTPSSGQYTDVTSTGEPGLVSPTALPDVKIDLSRLLNE